MPSGHPAALRPSSISHPLLGAAWRATTTSSTGTAGAAGAIGSTSITGARQRLGPVGLSGSVRWATYIKRPKRPYTFTQLVALSDGSTYLQRTTSPQPVYRSTKDSRNTLLWNPSNQSLANVEEDEAGKLRAFRQRFGRGWDAEAVADADADVDPDRVVAGAERGPADSADAGASASAKGSRGDAGAGDGADAEARARAGQESLMDLIGSFGGADGSEDGIAMQKKQKLDNFNDRTTAAGGGKKKK